MKIIIAGGRDFDNYELLKSKCEEYLSNSTDIEIVCGGAKGADTLGEKYAKERDYRVKYFPGEWDKHGKRAGPMRNRQMAYYADALIAFWDGKSSGTANMIETAKKLFLKVRVVRY